MGLQKDENIVIDSNFRVKLIDFGSASVIPSPMHYFDKFQGTIQFASPEILSGKKYLGKPNDVRGGVVSRLTGIVCLTFSPL